MAPPQSRKSKQAELPAVDAAAADFHVPDAAPTEPRTLQEEAAMTDQKADTMTSEAGTETPAAQANAAFAAEIKSLRGELLSQMNWVFGAIGAASVAFLLALTSPLWSSHVVANDAHTIRTMALASAYLGRVAGTSDPFLSEMDLLRRSLPNDAQVSAIIGNILPVAETGALTVAELRVKLETMANDVFMGKVVGNDNWVNSSVTRLASIARIESLATTVAPKYSGEEVALVHEAEDLIAKGELKMAVGKLEQLTGRAAETALPWLDAARKRLLLDEKIKELSDLVVARASERPYFALR